MQISLAQLWRSSRERLAEMTIGTVVAELLCTCTVKGCIVTRLDKKEPSQKSMLIHDSKAQITSVGDN